MNQIRKLIDIAGEAIRQDPPDIARLRKEFGHFAADQLASILTMKNGFYAFEGALHVLSDSGTPPEVGLFAWNAPALWRKDYKGMANSAMFFAEDAFGTQFCIHDGAIATFNPETGEFEPMAATVSEWATKILRDYSYWSGHAVARSWQLQHGKLPAGARLVPATPFVLGGEYDSANVRAVDAVKGMRYRASIAVQIRDLPDGAQIELTVIE